MQRVLDEWFAHLGKTPKYLLGGSIDSNDLILEIKHAFKMTKKDIGVNILRHAYITNFFKQPRSIKEKEDLAKMMLHDKDRQEKYAVMSELKGE
jgi:hypothetical protein